MLILQRIRKILLDKNFEISHIFSAFCVWGNMKSTQESQCSNILTLKHIQMQYWTSKVDLFIRERKNNASSHRHMTYTEIHNGTHAAKAPGHYIIVQKGKCDVKEELRNLLCFWSLLPIVLLCKEGLACNTNKERRTIRTGEIPMHCNADIPAASRSKVGKSLKPGWAGSVNFFKTDWNC